MADGTNVGSIYYDVTLETARIIESRLKVETELKKAGDAGDALKTRFKTIAAGISAALATIGAKHLVDEIIRVQREFDVLSVQLKTAVGGSADLAAAQMERLQKFAQETPYGLKQVVDGFTKLVNLGLDPSERAMRSFGDTAAAMGKSMMQFIEAVADASTGQFERLLEFGVKAKTEGSKVAFTFKNVKTEVANNATAITEYLTRLGEVNFAGAMIERTKPLDGAIGTLKDTWEGLLLTVSQSGFGDAVAAGVCTAIDAISAAEASIRRGSLTEYFDDLRPVIQAAEVAATSLAAVVAGRLVSSFAAATAGLVSKAAAARAAAAEAVVLAQAELAAAVAAEKAAVANAGMGYSLTSVAAASARTAAAQEALAVAQTAQARSATVAGVALRGGAAIIGALGGPLGIAVPARSVLALSWDKVGLRAESAASISEKAAGRIRAALSDTGGTPMKDLQDQLSGAQKGLEEVDALIARAEKGASGGSFGKQAKPDLSGLYARRDAYREVVIQTQAAMDDLKKQQVKKLFPDEMPAPPKSKQEPDKNALAKAQEAQAYYQALVAANAQSLARIDAEEQQALADNRKRMIEDKENAAVYMKARGEIVKKFNRERAQLEEQTQQEIADLQIELTTDAEAKIEAVRVEAIRRAGAAERLGTVTHEQAERAKTAATFRAEQERAALAERLAQTVAETRIEATLDELTRIDLVRQENFRRADAAAKAGAITYAQAEADKARAAVQAQQAIRQQVLSINPLAALQQEYEQKLSIVRLYEQQMAQAGVDGQQWVEQKRTELATQFQQQRQALAEAEFVSQGAANKAAIDTLNSLGQTATGTITGLITGTMTAADAMRNLAGVVLNEAVGALVQIGVQYIKNAVIGQAADQALMATKAANAALYTAAITAQVGVNTALAAQGAFAATAAIPIIGPMAAPAAAAAAGAAAAALGAPAVAAAPVAGARRYGGGTEAGSMYRVNESGAPEMWTSSSGQQYMLTGGQRGSVTPADQVGAGANITLQVTVENNHPTAGVSVQQDGAGQARVIINEVASQISERRGPVWGALRTTNVQGRPG